jgi:hypothetical protein
MQKHSKGKRVKSFTTLSNVGNARVKSIGAIRDKSYEGGCGWGLMSCRYVHQVVVKKIFKYMLQVTDHSKVGRSSYIL